MCRACPLRVGFGKGSCARVQTEGLLAACEWVFGNRYTGRPFASSTRMLQCTLVICISNYSRCGA